MEMGNFKATVTKEHYGIPEGSTIHVKKELKKHYKGTWSSMLGSYVVKVRKEFCEIKK
jgi:hypothetical protein